MPGANVSWPISLTRLPQWFMGQMGVPGSDVELGLRSHSIGSVFYVDPNHLDASDANDGTDPDHPLLTVAEAITCCEAHHGDTIAVMANGGYQFANSADGYQTTIAEEVTLDVAGVRLVGIAPAGTVGVVWEPVTAAGLGTCITVTAVDCLIEGFTFQGGTPGGRAIYAEWNGTTTFADNVIVRHCMFDPDIDIGIELEFVYFADIHDCWFQQCDTYGIYTDAAGSASAYCSIHDNWFQDAAAAMSIAEADSFAIFHNYIFNTTAQAAGAAANVGINTGSGGHNIVFDNYFSCLLPVPANGDWDNMNSGDSTDAWVGNHCMNGLAVTIPT